MQCKTSVFTKYCYDVKVLAALVVGSGNFTQCLQMLQPMSFVQLGFSEGHLVFTCPKQQTQEKHSYANLVGFLFIFCFFLFCLFGPRSHSVALISQSLLCRPDYPENCSHGVKGITMISYYGSYI